MKVLVSYVCFDRQYFNTVDSLYLDYPLSQSNFLVTCEFEIERIHYKYFHNTPFLSYLGRCSLLLNSAGKSSALWPYSGWVFLRLLTDGWGGRGSKKPPLPKICLTFPTIMELATVIPYLKKDLINHLTHPLSYADTSIFSSKIRKFCYFKKRS